MPRKKSPLFVLKNSKSQPVEIYNDKRFGSIWALYKRGKPFWSIRMPGMTYDFPVHDSEPERFHPHIVEEAAHRLRDVVTLKIEIARIVDLNLERGFNLQTAVEKLDEWYRGDEYWIDDQEWQNHTKR